MEAEQTTTTAPEENGLKTWWENAAFEGKEFTNLQDDGTLVLAATPFSEQRSLGQLTADNAEAFTKALSEKFPEVTTRVKELATEWDGTEDKMKLHGKVIRTRDYLLHANAIGDFAPLYKQLAGWYDELSALSDAHYKAKQALVEKAMQLAESDNWKETTAAMRALSDEWKATGFTDKDRSDELWNALEAARNKFYDRKRQHQETQEKELLQNLDIKMELVEKAENLAASENWRQTTEAFKALMEQWKETGRTISDKNEALWQRFIAAKNVFFDRKKEHFDYIQQEQEGNYAKKLDIVTRAEALSESRDWNATSAAYAALMDEWKASGRVPAEKADELWDRMSRAKDVFFNNKRHHLETQRVTLDDNMAQKRALIKRAQELQHSTHWRETTDEFAELMEEWKKIGPVPREWNEKLWEQFIGARRAFFDSKDKDRDRRRGQIARQQEDRLAQTRQFLQSLKNELKEDEESLEDYKVSLTNITPGPKARELQAHLEKLIAQAGPSLKRKQEKIDSVARQLEELEAAAKKPRRDGGDRPAAKAAGPAEGGGQAVPAPQPLLSNEAEERAVAGDEQAPQKGETQLDAGAGTPSETARPETDASAEDGATPEA